MCDAPLVTAQLLSVLQPTWRELWAVAEEEAQRDAVDPRYVFEDIGLMLQPPDEPLPVTYDATPRDAVTFASTGGDGVHFSAAHGASAAIILMTVPMQFERPNVVVGSTLREFLSLGSAAGFFWLEQLAYDYACTVSALAAGPTAENDEAERQLTLLRERLALPPWPDPKARLDELQALVHASP